MEIGLGIGLGIGFWNKIRNRIPIHLRHCSPATPSTTDDVIASDSCSCAPVMTSQTLTGKPLVTTHFLVSNKVTK